MAQPNIRREGREVALQFLFSHDLNESLDPDQSEDFWKLRPTKDRSKRFAKRHLRGIVEHLAVIDKIVVEATENYRLDRITPVDRNIIRMATYELLFREDIPAGVAINEAIEVAKRFGAEESPKFINGVLDRIHKDVEAGVYRSEMESAASDEPTPLAETEAKDETD